MRFLIIAASIIFVLAGCQRATRQSDSGPSESPSSNQVTIQFGQVERPWDTEIIYQTGEVTILESLGGGVGVIDYDGDAIPDLLFPSGGTVTESAIQGLPSRLLRGIDDSYREVTERSEIGVARHYSHGCTVGDFNNDGFPDALITGYGGLTLWKNQGDGTFADVTSKSGLDDAQWSTGAAWGDLNADGAPDLYVAHYVNWSLKNNPRCTAPDQRPDVCPPRQFDPLDDVLYFGTGDGRFTNQSTAAGLVSGGKGLGVLMFDADHDADLDLYVANDTTNNFLYINDGSGRLQEQGLLAGCAVDDLANANGSMGIAQTDYDNDGRADIWVTNYEDEVFALYHSTGAAQYTHVSRSVGAQLLGQLFVGFGCVAGDWDLDGDEDFAVANGHVIRIPRNAPRFQQPLLLENKCGTTFSRVNAPRGYFSKSWAGRGLASLDTNGDGLLDFVFVNSNQPAALVRNMTRAEGRSIQLQIIGRRTSRDATGTRVELIVSGDTRKYVRWICGGGSYLSSSSRVIHFGLPRSVTVEAVEITWPGRSHPERISADQFDDQLLGHRSVGDRIVCDQIHVIVEPAEDRADMTCRTISLPRVNR